MKKNLHIQYQEFKSPEELTPEEQDLIKKAWTARKSSYAPYSHFNVGAIVKTIDNQIIEGSNQENANYKGTCAERNVLDSCGVKRIKDKVDTIVIVGGPEDLDLSEIPEEDEEPIPPCGQCRQDIKEVEDLAGKEITIILASRNKIQKFIGIDNLLPFPFGPKDLGIDY